MDYKKVGKTYPKTIRYYSIEDIKDIIKKKGSKATELRRSDTYKKEPKAISLSELQRISTGRRRRTTFPVACARRCESVNKEPEQSEDSFSPCINNKEDNNKNLYKTDILKQINNIELIYQDDNGVIDEDEI